MKPQRQRQQAGLYNTCKTKPRNSDSIIVCLKRRFPRLYALCERQRIINPPIDSWRKIMADEKLVAKSPALPLNNSVCVF